MERVKSHGQPALALTDHGNLFGAVEFYGRAKTAGVKPILGCEVYVAHGSRHDRTRALDGKGAYNHLVLLARNREGYRNLMRLSGETDSFVLDMHRVTFLTEGGARLLHDVRKSLFAQGKALVYSRIRGRAAVLNALRHTVPEGDNGFLSFEDNDLAVEWCEDRLLASHNVPLPRASTLASFPLFAGIGAKALARLAPVMPSVVFPAGATIISAGPGDDDRIFFIESGEVSVVLSLSDGSHQRIATLSSGMSFGEMTMLGSTARSASVHADTEVRAWTLRASALDVLALQHPNIKITILKNLSLDLAQRLRQANLLIGTLAA